MTQQQHEQLLTNVLKASRLHERATQHFNQMFFLLKQRYPHLSEKKVEDLEKRYGPQEYCEHLKALFDKHFSEDELQQLLNFWTSKAGSKLVSGSFAYEEQELGKKWAIDLESEIIEDDNSDR